MRRAILVALLVTMPAILGASGAAAVTTPTSFAIHLECRGDLFLDVVVLSDDSYAALVEGLRRVGVLKGVDMDADGTPEFLVPGFTLQDLTSCLATADIGDGSHLEFVAYVLFTPRREA
jgi:hypothetical protein